jgi:hypothetical protein
MIKTVKSERLKVKGFYNLQPSTFHLQPFWGAQ